MIPYWIVFAILGYFALVEKNRRDAGQLGPTWVFVGIILVAFIGLRYQVGGDWYSYELYLENAGTKPIGELLFLKDPGYQIINFGAAKAGFGIWAVNGICGVIFVFGLMRLAANQPYPYLCLTIAFPYIITVIALGYTRQSAALGIIMGAIAAMERNGSLARFSISTLLASALHRTSLLILPIFLFVQRKSMFVNAVAAVIAGFVAYDVFLEDSVDVLLQNYVEARYESEGALIRVSMNVVPAILVLLWGKRMEMEPQQLRLWRTFAWVSLATVPALILSPSSTAVDRVALYLQPIQIVILSRLPRVSNQPFLVRLGLIAYAGLVLLVWLNFAGHANSWIPYRSIVI